MYMCVCVCVCVPFGTPSIITRAFTRTGADPVPVAGLIKAVPTSKGVGGGKLLYAGFETCFGWDPQHPRAGIVYAQDECPIINQSPLRVA